MILLPFPEMQNSNLSALKNDIEGCPETKNIAVGNPMAIFWGNCPDGGYVAYGE